jgi:hypothetical protein
MNGCVTFRTCAALWAKVALIVSVLVPYPLFPAHADHEACSDVLVSVRAVRAEGHLNRDEARAEPVVTSDLSDLSEKLAKLPYKRFVLMGRDKFVVPIRKRHSVSIAGQELVLRPMVLDSKRVALWINWKDEAGSKVLDSRLYLTPGESMLAGTDHSAETGLIMAIDVHPLAGP